jgi:haloacetate dehalogenase
MPVLAVWGTRGVVGRQFDCVADWRAVADNVTGHALDCAHFIAEERPAELLAVLQPFLRAARTEG